MQGRNRGTDGELTDEFATLMGANRRQGGRNVTTRRTGRRVDHGTRPGLGPNTEIDAGLVSLLPREWMEQNQVLPVRMEGDFLVVAMTDPDNPQLQDDVARRTGMIVRPIKAGREELLWWLEILSDRDEAMELETLLGRIPEGLSWDVEGGERDAVADSAIVQLAGSLIREAVISRASDIHLIPTRLEVRVLYRVDGRLEPVARVDKMLQQPLSFRFKIMANLDITDTRRPMDGRFTTRIGKHVLDVRIATRPTIHGEKIVLRLLDKSAVIVRFTGLGMTQAMGDSLQRSVEGRSGLVLITGPTGSGKTTTLYACLHRLRGRGLSIDTIEDPVEYQLTGVGQTDVTPATGLMPIDCLRSVLRQDPDVIMVSEIRDLDIAEVAFQAALSGHLVLSTLHTVDCVGTIVRLLNLGVAPHVISSGLRGIIAQRLVRRLCSECRQPTPFSEALLTEYPWLREWASTASNYRAEGCPHCSNRGYNGRIGIFQVMEIGPEMRDLIMQGAGRDALEAAAMRAGMLPLISDGLRKVRGGVASLEEVMAACTA